MAFSCTSVMRRVVILSVAMTAIAAVGATPEENELEGSSGGRFLLQESALGGRHLLNNLDLCGPGNAPNFSCPQKFPSAKDIRCCVIPKVGKVCKDVGDEDDDNCGACNNKCNFGFDCCGGVCTNKLTDRNNCGECGRRCASGIPCRRGMCGY